ncbi:MAG TPA: hypothetical protein VGD56_22385 [Gemmatirosa sp.]
MRGGQRGGVVLDGVLPDGAVEPLRGGEAVVPVDPVAAPDVPPLMSLAGDCVVSVRCRRVRARCERIPADPLAPIDESAMPPDIPPLMLPPLMLPPLIAPDDMLLLSRMRLRRLGRTDELRLIVETLAVSPVEVATVVWLTLVT